MPYSIPFLQSKRLIDLFFIYQKLIPVFIKDQSVHFY